MSHSKVKVLCQCKHNQLALSGAAFNYVPCSSTWFDDLLQTSGANPIVVKKGIDKTCEFLVGKLKEKAKPVTGSLDIKASDAVFGG